MNSFQRFISSAEKPANVFAIKIKEYPICECLFFAYKDNRENSLRHLMHELMPLLVKFSSDRKSAEQQKKNY